MYLRPGDSWSSPFKQADAVFGNRTHDPRQSTNNMSVLSPSVLNVGLLEHSLSEEFIQYVQFLVSKEGQSFAMKPGIVEHRKEYLYKILVIGEIGSGKTSIVKRYVHQFFSQHYRATIGVDFALKVMKWNENTLVRLQLWDIAGQERFGSMTRVYYKEAVGALLVFDVTRSVTFDAVEKWKQDLDAKVQLPDGTNVPCVLLANKCDQPKEGLVEDSQRMNQYCKEMGFSGWFETSAKDNINIDEAVKFLVTKIISNESLSLHPDDLDKERLILSTPSKNGGIHQRHKGTTSCCS